MFFSACHYFLGLLDSMSSGRLCLGRIKSIEPYYLNVSLLHGAKGRVQIADISSPYREALERLLSGDINVCLLMFVCIFYSGKRQEVESNVFCWSSCPMLP